MVTKFNSLIKEFLDTTEVEEPKVIPGKPKPQIKPNTPSQPRPQHPLTPSRPDIKPRPKAQDKDEENPDVKLFYKLRNN